MAGDPMVGTSIEFFVSGEPIPQGSSKGFPVKRANGKMGVAITHANPRTMDWRQRIATEAQRRNAEVFEGDRFYRAKHNGVDDGVRVVATFYLPKPKSAKKNAVPSKKPDADKLIRNLNFVLNKIRKVFQQRSNSHWTKKQQHIVIKFFIRAKIVTHGFVHGGFIVANLRFFERCHSIFILNIRCN